MLPSSDTAWSPAQAIRALLEKKLAGKWSVAVLLPCPASRDEDREGDRYPDRQAFLEDKPDEDSIAEAAAAGTSHSPRCWFVSVRRTGSQQPAGGAQTLRKRRGWPDISRVWASSRRGQIGSDRANFPPAYSKHVRPRARQVASTWPACMFWAMRSTDLLPADLSAEQSAAIGFAWPVPPRPRSEEEAEAQARVAGRAEVCNMHTMSLRPLIHGGYPAPGTDEEEDGLRGKRRKVESVLSMADSMQAAQQANCAQM